MLSFAFEESSLGLTGGTGVSLLNDTMWIGEFGVKPDEVWFSEATAQIFFDPASCRIRESATAALPILFCRAKFAKETSLS